MGGGLVCKGREGEGSDVGGGLVCKGREGEGSDGGGLVCKVDGSDGAGGASTSKGRKKSCENW